MRMYKKPYLQTDYAVIVYSTSGVGRRFNFISRFAFYSFLKKVRRRRNFSHFVFL